MALQVWPHDHGTFLYEPALKSRFVFFSTRPVRLLELLTRKLKGAEKTKISGKMFLEAGVTGMLICGSKG